MRCKDILAFIEEKFPKEAALEWDNVGLLVGTKDKEVKRIYIALDLTDEVIQDAIEQKTDLIITHHPLIFSPLKKINDEDFIASRVLTLVKHDISYYAMHTNYDILRMGELAANTLGLKQLEPFEESGIGVCGVLDAKVTLATLCERVKTKFSLPAVKVFGDMKKEIAKIAISPGSGKHMSEIAIAKNMDVLITAEIDHHEGIDAVARDVMIIDAGHYGLEQIFIDDMCEFIKELKLDVDVAVSPVSHPFQIV